MPALLCTKGSLPCSSVESRYPVIPRYPVMPRYPVTPPGASLTERSGCSGGPSVGESETGLGGGAHRLGGRLRRQVAAHRCQ